MALKLLNSWVRPHDGQDIKNGIIVEGETTQRFFYCVKGVTSANQWWFTKFTQTDRSDERDMLPDEALTVLNELILSRPDLRKMLTYARDVYRQMIMLEKSKVRELLNESLVGKTFIVSRLSETIQPSSGDKFYSGFLPGPIFYQLIFRANGEQTFLKSAHSDMRKSKPCTTEEALFILQSILSRDIGQNHLCEQLMDKINNPQPVQAQEQPDIRLVRYNGAALLDRNNPSKGFQITGEINGYYFCMSSPLNEEISFLKSKLRNMRGAQQLTAAERDALLPQLIAKEKDPTIKKHLQDIARIFLQEKAQIANIYDSEPLNMDLMTDDFAGKTEVYGHPEETINNATQREYIGFLRGHIFYRFQFTPETFHAHKATNKEMTDAVPCSRKEVRFILKTAKEKYKHDAYETMQHWVEEYWKSHDEAQEEATLESLYDKMPVVFLNNTELLAGFTDVPAVIYKDEKGNRHITFKQDGELYHIAPDEDKPVFAAIGSKYKPMKLNVLYTFFVAFENADDETLNFIYHVNELYGRTKNKAPKEWHHESFRSEDINRLVSTLKWKDIREKAQQQAYPQLQQPSFKISLPVRLKQNQNPFIRMLRNQLNKERQKS